MKVVNRNVDLCPEQFLGGAGQVLGSVGDNNKRVPALVADVMRARAQCTCFFTKVVLASTEECDELPPRLLNSAGQMR